LKRDQVKRLKELEKENDRLRKAVSDLTLGEADPERGCLGKLLSPSRRRRFVDHVIVKFSVSERLPARFSASIARPSARSRKADRMKRH
jgi:hypothetical protein